MTAPAFKARIPELDGLRGVAILLVIAYHYLEPLQPSAKGALRIALAPARMGWIGVDLFFVLSGYLIASILLANRESTSYFRTFYIRRFCRILPLYLLVVIGGVLVHERYVRTPAPPLYQYLLFVQNFWMAHMGMFGNGLLAITWSLAVEEQFYLVLPPLVRFARSKSFLAIVIACLLLAPLLRYFLLVMQGPRGMFTALVLLFTHLDTLMLGVLLAWLRLKEIAIPRRIVTVVWILTAATIAFAAFQRPKADAISESIAIAYEVIVLFCASTLFLALDGKLPFLRWKALTYTGVISYGLYLMHQPLNWAMHRLFHWSDWKDVRLAAVSFVLVYVIAALSWLVFEQRFVRFGHRFRYQERE